MAGFLGQQPVQEAGSQSIGECNRILKDVCWACTYQWQMAAVPCTSVPRLLTPDDSKLKHQCPSDVTFRDATAGVKLLWFLTDVAGYLLEAHDNSSSAAWRQQIDAMVVTL